MTKPSKPREADEPKALPVAKVSALAIAVVCDNPDCDERGEVIEEVELDITGKDEKPLSGPVVRVRPDETVTCDECETKYRLPIIKIKYNAPATPAESTDEE